METVILAVLGLMGTWNIAVTIWVLRWRRNNHKPGNPHPLPCAEHGRALTRIENDVKSAIRGLTKTQKTVALLWNDAHPGQPEPNRG